MSKRSFKVSTEEVNTYGIVVRTMGGDFASFLKNPVMLFNHNEHCVIGRWENLRVEGTDLLADPVFDMEDEEAAKIAGKVERDIIRATSISLRPQEAREVKWADNREVIEVTKWELREISVASIPSNRSALRLLDENDCEIVLSDTVALSDIVPTGVSRGVLINQPNNSSMDLKAMAVALKLAEAATEAEVLTRLSAVVQAETELADLKKGLANQRKAEAVKLCDAAIADKRLDATKKEVFLQMADANFEFFKTALESIPKPTNLADYARQGAKQSAGEVFDEDQEAIKLYDGYDKKGLLVKLKKDNFDEFKRLFKAKFGKEPQS